jgi:manganese/zinc/iron transport system substrate-binding protein
MLSILLITSGLSACKTDERSESLELVATTTMLADLAENLGKGRLEVTGLMGPGVDPHLYKAGASDVDLLQNADIILINGLDLEGKMGDVLESLKKNGRQIISLEDGLDTSRLLRDEENHDIFDPHIWFDVSLWQDAARYVCSKLCELDKDGEEIYQKQLDLYITELEELDDYIKIRVAELPEDMRVLVTAHDAFQYFGHAYGFEVKGLQGISTATEAGTGDMIELADFIADKRIQAIFIETSIPPRNIEALQAAVSSRGFDVKIGGELYSDSLGDAQSGHDSYIATFRANIDTIVESLK